MNLPENEELCYENAYSVVSWHTGLHFLHIVYKGVFVGNNFYEGGNRQVDALVAKGGKRILYDLRRFPVSTQTNVQWIMDDYLPKMKMAGLTHISAIMPEDYYGRAAAAYILNRCEEHGFSVRRFDTEAEAVEWLAELHQAAPGA
jgi:hypothetical protein